MAPTFEMTIITPTLNQKQYIERTIQSVLSQVVDFPFEYIVMDGGSIDGTPDVLQKYGEKIQWVSQKDQGQSDAINQGMGLSKGKIVAWLNSDDIYLPGALQKVKNLFDAFPNNHWLYGNCTIIDDQDREIRKLITWYKNLLSRHFNYNTLLLENFLSQPAVFFKRDLFNQVGALSAGLHLAMDFDLWVRFAQTGKPIATRENLAGFRVHENSKSARNVRKLFAEQLEIHKRYDNRKAMHVLHRLSILKTLAVYHVLAIRG